MAYENHMPPLSTINQGTRDLYIDKDNGWTSYTKDGKLSAQWENTILVTEKGIEVLAW